MEFRHRADSASGLPGPTPLIVLDEEGLLRVLASYVRYYHRSRLHLSLDRDAPDARPVQAVGPIVAVPEVGGLHHRYERRAA